MRRSFIRTFCFLLLGTLGLSGNAYSKPPVVVEFFGKDNCAADIDIQESLQEIVQNEQDVLLINCRGWYDGEDERNRFSHSLCNKRYKTYDMNFRTAVLFTEVAIVVNGKWDAYMNDITPAINLGRTDNVQPIEMRVHETMMDISVPEIESKVGHGEIFLYAYAPTQGEESYFVDPDVEFTDQMREDIRLDKSVPFVTKRRTGQLYVRPILSIEKIGKWVGQKMDLNYPLQELTSMAGELTPDLSYVVVVHEGHEFGPVIAAGEIMSSKEFYNSLPQSQADNIEFTSQPTDALLTVQ